MTAPPADRLQLVDRLLPVAAELVGTVRDYGPDDVAAVLRRVPEGRHDALAVVLAAMVDPDKSPRQLLGWLAAPPPSRGDAFRPRHLTVGEVTAASTGRRPERRADVARLTALGLTTRQIAERLGITTRSVERHRAALRKALAA